MTVKQISPAAAWALTMGVWCVSLAQADHIVLRDGAGGIDGRTIEVTPGGVLFDCDDPLQRGKRLITLDRVRDLETDDAQLAAQWEAEREFSVALWRARSRVERGDFALAEPVFEDLFEQTRGQTDASALIVAEGLLRCRLARGAYTLAVMPWLEMRRLIQSGQLRGAFLSLDEVVDPVTGLCVDLPPVWAKSMALEKLVNDLDGYRPEGAGGVRALAVVYAHSARLAMGPGQYRKMPISVGEVESLNDPGAALAWAVVASQDPTTSSSNADIDRLTARYLRDASAFTPWAYFARGTVRVRSVARDTQAQGLVDLLTIPALFTKSAPVLSGFALGRSADVLEGLGRREDAVRLRDELEHVFPGHPLNRVSAVAAVHTTKD